MPTQERPVWRIWIVLWVVAALQTTWFARWQPLGSHVDLILLSLVSVSLLLGWEVGAIYGMIAGIVTGFCAVNNVGSYAVSRCVAGALVGVFERRVSSDNPLAPPLCAAGMLLVANLVYWLMSPADFVYWGMTEHGFSAWWWLQRTAGSMLLHAALICPLHWLLARYVLPPVRSPGL